MQRSHNTSLSAILSQIDNRPSWYTVKHFRCQLLHFLIDDYNYIVEELDDQLQKSKRSYQDICMHLAKAQKPGDAIHFIVSSTSLMINIPLLMVYPEQTVNKNTNRVTFNYKEMASCGALS